MGRKEKIIAILCVFFTLAAGVLHYAGANAIVAFAVTAAALALLAVIVGDATEQLGSRLGPGATGVLQSSLGNLPELFVCIFALKAGLVGLVQAALIGSILGNALLVFGVALFLGGLKNGTQTFRSEPPKMIATLMIIAVAALMIPTLAKELHTPAEAHVDSLDIVCSVVLLILLAANVYFSLKGDPSVATGSEHSGGPEWALSTAIIALALAGVGAAFVSDWFVASLEPVMHEFGLSQTFTGLVVVAIAGNSIENLVGIQFAWRNQADYAVSIMLNSSLQIALGLIPILVLLSFVLGGAVLTLVLPPLLIAALALAAIVNAFVVYDGESIWLEGLALIGLYCIIAASFWWG
ncbi:MAG TPA: calcium/proton exchanger [Pyrinomonadaceae bacterium]|jgi:Ca2+:H+ antiporter|nr:calcium/proton exchanger [Pyrinomonadaceae bacterium]